MSTTTHQTEFLSWKILPARLDAAQTAWYLGFEPHEIPMLIAANLLTGRLQGLHARHSLTRHDLSGFTLSSSRPTAFQLDGEYLGERTKVTFSAVPDAVRVFC